MKSALRKIGIAFMALSMIFSPPTVSFSQEVVFSPDLLTPQPTLPVTQQNTVILTSEDEIPSERQNSSVPAGPLSAPTLEAETAIITEFPGRPVLSIFANDGTATTEQLSSTLFRLHFDLSSEDGFGGAIINFGASPAGPQDLSGIDPYIFEIQTDITCTIPESCLKLEFLDAAGQLAVVDVPALSSDFQAISIAQTDLLTANAALNLASIKQINFVVEGRKVAPNAGTLDIRAGGLTFTPTVAGTSPAVTETVFPGSPPVITFANEAQVTVETISPAHFRINYDLSTPESFGGGILFYAETASGFQDFSTAEEFQFNLRTDNLCATSPCLKVEFQDADGRTAAVNVASLSTDFRAIKISRTDLETSNPDLDFARIRQINFVLEERNLNPKSGFLEVQTGPVVTTGGTTPPPPPETEPPLPGPNPDPDPTPDPTPDPDPETGLVEGSTVSGILMVQPRADLLGETKKSAFYLNGTKAGKSYEAPYVWGGPDGFDTSTLPDGTYTLSGAITTAEGDQEFSITFTVQNGTVPLPEPEPQTAPEGAITGLTQDQTAGGEITVQPDLEAQPDIHKVYYYLDGQIQLRTYEAPFVFTFDADSLAPGEHTLSGIFTTTGDDNNLGTSLDQVFEILFVTGAVETEAEVV